MNNNESFINAISNGDIVTVKKLVNSGIKIDTAKLNIAIRTGLDRMVNYLLINNPNVTTESLVEAVRSRNPKILGLLLKRVKHSSIPNTYVLGKLPIEWAIDDSQWDIVNILLRVTDKKLISQKRLKKLEEIRNIKFVSHMPDTSMFDTFDAQVSASFEDLSNISNIDIKSIAEYLKINGVSYKSSEQLRKEVAQKLIYYHTNDIPIVEKDKCIRYQKKFTEEQLAELRDKIYNHFIEFKDSVTKMTTEDLYNIFKMYDKLFFDGDIERYMKSSKYGLKFKTSGEDTFTTEGICTFKVCDYTITIPTSFFANAKKDGLTNIAGHMCKDQLECLQRVLEHEITHLIIFMFCANPFIADQHGELFMQMVSDLFKHTDHRHYLF